MEDSKLKEAISKVALGYSLREVTEEYGVEDGEVKLVKRKETKKDIPPDLKAVRLLLEEGEDITNLSDEALETEKQRLLRLLKEDN